MDRLEKKILQIIDEHREEIIAFGRDIWTHAEMGYKEFRTAGKFAEKMKGNAETVEGLAITGVKSYLKPKTEGDVNVCLMGELDALPISNHRDTNPETGASHCCGHNAQITGLVGAKYALEDEEIKAALGGNVIFFAVPAEEFVDIEFKNDLIRQGKIGYGGGKCELIRIGALEDIDVTVGHHTDPAADARIGNGASNGFVNKTVCFTGKASHAAGAPDKGVDALAARDVAVTALNAQRETFRDRDAVRVHGFVSRGGEAMNVIADTVTMEYSVRANNIPAYKDASEKFDRSMRAGAIALGAGCEIVTLPGYLPTIPLENVDVMAEAISDVMGEYNYTNVDLERHPAASTGSTDYGDLSSLIPLFQFKTGGYTGELHNVNMDPVDEELAYIVTAKIFAVMAYKLLKNNAEEARKTMASFTPLFTRQEYCALMDSLSKTEVIEPNFIKPLD
ncbi:MAG: amidohydrolase [Solobacterium sp.]|nr:amidohydrolase [Solobacterium sp.]